ncbi:MAG TPA: hypothetical protein VNA57_05250 [Acidimicrobiales bacterium]|nr:hypothetical protein [Acidimicrobiales bacterium]
MAQTVMAAVGLLIAALTYLGIQVLKPPKPRVEITSPSNNARVGTPIEVAGVWENVSRTKNLWVVVLPDGAEKRYYPKGSGSTELRDNGTWSQCVEVGEPGGPQGMFTLYVYLATDEQTRAVRERLRPELPAYNEGLPTLPDLGVLMDEIRVSHVPNGLADASCAPST